MVHHRVRTGEFDFDLLKPVSSQFLMAFRSPWVDAVIFFMLVSALFIRQIVILKDVITPLSMLLFFVSTALCVIIWYFVMTGYATVSFYVTRAQQVVYFLEKTSDYALYPTSIFPSAVQMIFFSIIPVAFMGYIPTMILLNRGELWMWVGMVAVLIASGIVNRLLWDTALKHYSSASS